MKKDNSDTGMSVEEVATLEKGIKISVHISRAIYLSAIESGFNEAQAMQMAVSYFFTIFNKM